MTKKMILAGLGATLLFASTACMTGVCESEEECAWQLEQEQLEGDVGQTQQAIDLKECSLQGLTLTECIQKDACKTKPYAPGCLPPLHQPN